MFFPFRKTDIFRSGKWKKSAQFFCAKLKFFDTFN